MKRVLVVLTLLLLAVFGCSEDLPTGTDSDQTPVAPTNFKLDESDMQFTVDPNYGVPAGTRTYEVIIENLTPATGAGSSQPFSPPVLTTHRGDLRLFRKNRFASSELAQIAEDAVNGPMLDLLNNSGKTFDVMVGDGVILPGGEARFEITTGPAKRRLSVVFMLVNTNDGFGGLDAVRLPFRGEKVYYLRAYDAGSELNTELKSDIPGPCCGSPGAGTPTHDPISFHAGILGVGDLDPGVYGWEEPVAKLTVRRIDPTYEVVIENLTPQTVPGGSQVFSPPVLATHKRRIRIFKVGEFASPELSLIAEDGNTGPMVDLLTGSSEVKSVVTGDGPIVPGGSATYEIQADLWHPRLSAAFMLVNTNDGFSGISGLRLPFGGRVSLYLNSYDAGSEQNTELASDIPGPCCGSPGQGPDEHLPIRHHPGILGIGDLSVDDYGWSDPAVKLTITRTK